jgi:hypothetical protein
MPAHYSRLIPSQAKSLSTFYSVFNKITARAGNSVEKFFLSIVGVIVATMASIAEELVKFTFNLPVVGSALSWAAIFFLNQTLEKEERELSSDTTYKKIYWLKRSIPHVSLKWRAWFYSSNYFVRQHGGNDQHSFNELKNLTIEELKNLDGIAPRLATVFAKLFIRINYTPVYFIHKQNNLEENLSVTNKLFLATAPILKGILIIADFILGGIFTPVFWKATIKLAILAAVVMFAWPQLAAGAGLAFMLKGGALITGVLAEMGLAAAIISYVQPLAVALVGVASWLAASAVSMVFSAGLNKVRNYFNNQDNSSIPQESDAKPSFKIKIVEKDGTERDTFVTKPETEVKGSPGQQSGDAAVKIPPVVPSTATIAPTVTAKKRRGSNADVDVDSSNPGLLETKKEEKDFPNSPAPVVVTAVPPVATKKGYKPYSRGPDDEKGCAVLVTAAGKINPDAKVGEDVVLTQPAAPVRTSQARTAFLSPAPVTQQPPPLGNFGDEDGSASQSSLVDESNRLLVDDESDTSEVSFSYTSSLLG